MGSSVASAAAALHAIGGGVGPRPSTQRSRLRGLKALSELPGCIFIAIFNHKGGVGKSTHATLLAASLAKQGFRVGIIDADPQLSQSIQWADDDNAEGCEAEDGLEADSDEEAEEDWEAAGPLGGSQEAGSGFRLPTIAGDRLARGLDALHADTMRDAFDNLAGSDNLYDSLKRIGLSIDPSFVPSMRVCNLDDYEGRLLLLPSSPELFRYNDNLVANERTDMAGRVFGAYSKLLRGLAKKHDLDYIITDLGPHTDTLHKDIVASHHYLQLVVDPSMAAWASTYSLLTATLPAWIQWRKEFKPVYNQGDDDYHLNPSFPQILPVLGLKHTMAPDGSVAWSSSNIYTSIATTMNYELVPQEVKDLYLPSRDKTGSDMMLVPFLRNLDHLPVAQETGRAFFDLSRKSMEDYYQHHNLRKLKMEEVERERRYADRRYRSLARSMAELREQHLRVQKQRRKDKRQQEKQEQKEKEQDGGHKKKQRRK